MGVYLSTKITIGRLPESQQFHKILLKEFQGVPWKCGVGTIGTKLVPGLKECEPLPVESFSGPLAIGGPPPGNDEAASDPALLNLPLNMMLLQSVLMLLLAHRLLPWVVMVWVDFSQEGMVGRKNE